MANKVTLLPSQHTFLIEKNETLLEAALRSGLSVDYGCSNGACGKCQAKVISGQIEKSGFQDYVFSEAEKLAGQILLCRCIALTDAVLETKEATDTNEIPLQRLKAKIKKVESPTNDVKILHTRTPRSQRLRYIAGQRVKLINAKNDQRSYPVASCPCDALNQQFHIPYQADDEFLSTLLDPEQGNLSVEIEGPTGAFILQEASTRPILFIAYNTGFAPVKGLIEHALSLELSQDIHLIWISDNENGHYMHNYCRSISDAVDNFFYHPLTIDAKKIPDNKQVDQLTSNITTVLADATQPLSPLKQHDIYISAEPDIGKICENFFTHAGADSTHLFLETPSS